MWTSTKETTKRKCCFNTMNGFSLDKKKSPNRFSLVRSPNSVTQLLTKQYFNGHWLSTQTKEKQNYLRGTDLAIDFVTNEQWNKTKPTSTILCHKNNSSQMNGNIHHKVCLVHDLHFQNRYKHLSLYLCCCKDQQARVCCYFASEYRGFLFIWVSADEINMMFLPT